MEQLNPWKIRQKSASYTDLVVKYGEIGMPMAAVVCPYMFGWLWALSLEGVSHGRGGVI